MRKGKKRRKYGNSYVHKGKYRYEKDDVETKGTNCRRGLGRGHRQKKKFEYKDGKLKGCLKSFKIKLLGLV